MGKRVFCAILAIGWTAACACAPGWVTASLPHVRVERVTETAYVQSVTALGELTSESAREITLELPVVTRSVRVEVGDHVSAGQVLATVDRERTLQALSGASLDLSTLDLTSLLARYDAETLTSELESYLSQEMASIDMASLPELLPTQIVAPVSGVITALTAAENGAVTPLMPAFVVTPDERMTAVVRVRETDVAEVAVGQRAVVTCTALDGVKYDAEVIAIAPAATKALSGTTQETVVEATLRLDQPDEQLRGGYNVRAVICTDLPRMAAVVPYEAIVQTEDGGEYAFVIECGRAVRHRLETGAELNEGVEVLKGVKAGERVVLKPEGLRDGALVVVESEASE